MINFQFKINNNVLTFSRVLSVNEMQMTESELIALEDFIESHPFVDANPIAYGKDEIFNHYQNLQRDKFDEIGMFSLMNFKTMLWDKANKTADELLLLEMIAAVEKWINKLWENYTALKMQLEAGIQISDMTPTIAEPPCKFYDIVWVANLNNYRTVEPNRLLNQDINFYINYTA